MESDVQELGKKIQRILITIIAQLRTKYEGLGFSGKELSTSLSYTTFVKVRGTRKETIPIEEKEVGKGACRVPLNSPI